MDLPFFKDASIRESILSALQAQWPNAVEEHPTHIMLAHAANGASINVLKWRLTFDPTTKMAEEVTVIFRKPRANLNGKGTAVIEFASTALHYEYRKITVGSYQQIEKTDEMEIDPSFLLYPESFAKTVAQLCNPAQQSAA